MLFTVKWDWGWLFKTVCALKTLYSWKWLGRAHRFVFSNLFNVLLVQTQSWEHYYYYYVYFLYRELCGIITAAVCKIKISRADATQFSLKPSTLLVTILIKLLQQRLHHVKQNNMGWLHGILLNCAERCNIEFFLKTRGAPECCCGLLCDGCISQGEIF